MKIIIILLFCLAGCADMDQDQTRYFNQDGIRFTVSGDIPEAKKAVLQAKLLLRKTELMNTEGLEQAWNSIRLENGTDIHVGINHGIKTAKIYSPPTPKRLVKPKRPPRKEPIVRYVPAFHTYDADGKWLGITVCMSGKWGPPYRFIKCDSDKIYPFEYGFWNTEIGATRPEDYEKRLVAKDFGLDIDYYEVPAAHEFLASNEVLGNTDDTVGEWGAYYDETTCCEETKAAGVIITDATPVRTQKTDHAVVAWTDWAADKTAQPRVLDTEYVISTSLDIQNMAAWVAISGEGACGLLQPALTAAQEDIPPIGDLDPPTTTYTAYSDMGLYGSEFVHTVIEDGSSFRVLANQWGSFLTPDLLKGSMLCIETSIDALRITSSEYNPPLACGETYPPNATVTVGDLTLLGTIDAEIYVFGKKYNLLIENVTSREETAYGSQLRAGRLRIYQVGENRFYTLASAKFIEEDAESFTYQYLLFGGHLEQYNDPDATFEYTNENLTDYEHDLGFSVLVDSGLVAAYTNGEFSLIELRQSFDFE